MKVLETAELWSSKWLHVFRSIWEHNGKSGYWYFVSRKQDPLNHITNQPRNPDAVVIVPVLTLAHESLVGEFEATTKWTRDNYFLLREPRFVITSQFRVPLNDYEYGFVAGLIDGEEKPEETAARELKEETGLELINVLKVSPPIYSSAGLTDESVVMVFCYCRAPENFKSSLESDEDIKLHLLTHKELCELMKKPLKFAGKAWPIMYMFEQSRNEATLTF